MVENFDTHFADTLAKQTWSMYTVGMLLILLRMYARIHRLGIRFLQKDDYLMVIVGALYTILVACLNVIATGGGSNLYVPEDFPNGFSPQELADRIQGSKIVIVSEQAMLNVIWITKACMIIMYTRLTLGLTAERLVKYLAIYISLGWLAVEIAFFTNCRPFSGYWAVPPPDPQCTTLYNYAIVQSIFNVSSDLMMLFIPLPLVIRLYLPWRQKAMLVLIFSMGIFVILAAILTKVFNLMNVWDPSYMLWYTREASVAVYVSNLPLIWPLLREYFPALKALTPGQKSSTPQRLGTALSGTVRPQGEGRRHPSIVDGITTTIRGTKTPGSKSDSMEELSGGDAELGVITRQDSWDERSGKPVFGAAAAMDGSGWQGDLGKGGIQKVTTVHVTEEYIPDGEFGLDTRSPRGEIWSPRDLEKGKEWGR